MSPARGSRTPRSGEFFAPLPILALGLLVVNDTVLKPTFRSELTGKLSDIAVCFLMPLFLSELLGIALAVRPTIRLWLGAAVTAALYTLLEVCPPFTRLVLDLLSAIGPALGMHRPFRMTSDVTDLFCLALIPLAVVYGKRRLRSGPSAPAPGTSLGDAVLAASSAAAGPWRTPRSPLILLHQPLGIGLMGVRRSLLVRPVSA